MSFGLCLRLKESVRCLKFRARLRAPKPSGRRRAWSVVLHQHSQFPAVSHTGMNGISQVPWRPILRLCPALRPRPRTGLPRHNGFPGAAPGTNKARASAGHDFEANGRASAARCLRFTTAVAAAHAELASGWRAAPLPGGRRTPWVAMKGFRLHAILLSRT